MICKHTLGFQNPGVTLDYPEYSYVIILMVDFTSGNSVANVMEVVGYL